MRITALRGWIRRIVFLGLAASEFARAADKPADQINYLSDSLAEGNAAAALSVFDPQMRDFAEVKRDIEFLASHSGTNSQVKVDGELKPGAGGVSLQGEWKLELNPKQNLPLLIRTEKVSISLQQIGGEWKITRFAPLRLFAKPDSAVFSRIAALANDLSEGDEPDALAVFSSAMSNYGEVSADIDALVNQTQILCAIDIVDDNESAGIHKLDTDWYLELKSSADAGPTERRRERVEIQIELIKGKWRITAISPLVILAPIKIN